MTDIIKKETMTSLEIAEVTGNTLTLCVIFAA